MKRTAIAVSACLGIAPSAAMAFDWSLRTSQTETIELNDNLLMRPSPAGSLGSYSTLRANAEALTPTSKFNLDADGNYRKLWGPGVEGSPTESLSWGYHARYEATGKTRSDRQFLEYDFRQSNTAFAQLSDLGIVTNAKGFFDRQTFTGGLDRSLTALDSVSLFAKSTRSSFEPSSGGTAFTDTLARGSWQHRLSSLTSLNVSSEADLLNYENASNSKIQIYRNQLGINSTISPVLSFRGNIGAAYLVIENGPNPFSTIASNLLNPSRGSTTLLDWIGDAVLTYRVFKNTTFALNASQSVSPNVVGSLFKSDNIYATLSHTINSKSTLSFSSGISRTTATTTTDFASASVTYGYNFTQDLSAHLTYRHAHRFASSGGGTNIDPITLQPTVSGTGAASSNSIMLVVSNNFTILPHGN